MNRIITASMLLGVMQAAWSVPITTAGQPGQLDIRVAAENSIRLTLKPVSLKDDLPFSPALVQRKCPEPVISLREITSPVKTKVGSLFVEVRPNPLRVIITNSEEEFIQDIVFKDNGSITFHTGDQPILGMGEGGPLQSADWRNEEIEFNRRGRLHKMQPRWQNKAYGSRNPVALMLGTEGWGLFIVVPWGEIDLTGNDRGLFTPWQPPQKPTVINDLKQERDYIAQLRGKPPVDSIVPGVFDLFVIDAHDPAQAMKDISTISGRAVLPPKWALGYMQSHRTLEDQDQMIQIVKTFRDKEMPLDAVIYLGTGFCPRGWNTRQPSFDFNPEVFKSEPAELIKKLHELNARIILHMVPWGRDQLPSLRGDIPPHPGEPMDNSHILNYWNQHVALVNAGVDGWWPDEGDWFNLYERMKRHQLYYQGSLFTQPGIRPWSLHRNGYLGISRWGGWVWSGDTDSSWKTLEAQIAVGINHSLSLSPYWGSDIGGFTPNKELTGELYARWFQFGAFCPSFRSHGRTWWTRLPWGWGLGEMGPHEAKENPSISEFNNPIIEAVCRQYAQLRYQLMPYNYTLVWQARQTGMPLMRAMWLHYPDDENARSLGDQYLWGRDLLVAPVYNKQSAERNVYLPQGQWYDFWTNEKLDGSRWITRKVDLKIMPLYVHAGTILPFDPIRQYTAQQVNDPTTIRIYRGCDGEFVLYEDDGISTDYLEDKNINLTKFSWDDDDEQLLIESDSDLVIATGQKKYNLLLLPDGLKITITYSGISQIYNLRHL